MWFSIFNINRLISQPLMPNNFSKALQMPWLIIDLEIIKYYYNTYIIITPNIAQAENNLAQSISNSNFQCICPLHVSQEYHQETLLWGSLWCFWRPSRGELMETDHMRAPGTIKSPCAPSSLPICTKFYAIMPDVLFVPCMENWPCKFWLHCKCLLRHFCSFVFCFCSVTVLLLHCGSFCHENKFLVCVNIPSNKAHSDSDSKKSATHLETMLSNISKSMNILPVAPNLTISDTFSKMFSIKRTDKGCEPDSSWQLLIGWKWRVIPGDTCSYSNQTMEAVLVWIKVTIKFHPIIRNRETATWSPDCA